MRKFAMGSLILLCSFTFLSSASGELIPYQIQGVIDASYNPQNIMDPFDHFPGVLAGDSWTATFTVDTSVPDGNPADTSFGSYVMASPFHLTMGSVTRDYSDYRIAVLPNFLSSFDSVGISAPFTGEFSSPDRVSLSLDYVIGTFLGSDSIPPLDNMADFLPSSGNLNFSAPVPEFNTYGVIITGPVTSISIQAVPEPATMLLIGSGLIGLAGYGRKKFFKK